MLLLLFNALVLVLGTFMEPLPLMLVLAPIVFPMFQDLGVDPVHLGVVFVINIILGLVTPNFLRSKRRHAIVIITILASLITPGDLSSTLLLIGPMIVLYELSIILSRAIHGRARNAELAAGNATASAEQV